MKQDYDMMEFLLKNKFKVDVPVGFGDTALSLVCKDAFPLKTDMFVGPRKSLKEEAQVNNQNSFKCAKILIEAGADVNVCGKKGHSPFIYACIKENEDLVAFMLKHKADVFLRNGYNYTGLTYALQTNNENIINLILEQPKNEKEFQRFRDEIIQLKNESKNPLYDEALDILNAIEIKRRLDSDLPSNHYCIS